MSKDLIERLRAAEGPDRELDLEVERFQSGRDYYWVNDKRAIRYDKYGPDQVGNPVFDLPAYTASIDAALALVSEVLPNVAAHIITGRDGSSAGLIFSVFAQPRMVEHKSPAIALLIALLQAKEASENE